MSDSPAGSQENIYGDSEAGSARDAALEAFEASPGEESALDASDAEAPDAAAETDDKSEAASVTSAENEAQEVKPEESQESEQQEQAPEQEAQDEEESASEQEDEPVVRSAPKVGFQLPEKTSDSSSSSKQGSTQSLDSEEASEAQNIVRSLPRKQSSRRRRAPPRFVSMSSKAVPDMPDLSADNVEARVYSNGEEYVDDIREHLLSDVMENTSILSMLPLVEQFDLATLPNSFCCIVLANGQIIGTVLQMSDWHGMLVSFDHRMTEDNIFDVGCIVAKKIVEAKVDVAALEGPLKCAQNFAASCVLSRIAKRYEMDESIQVYKLTTPLKLDFRVDGKLVVMSADDTEDLEAAVDSYSDCAGQLYGFGDWTLPEIARGSLRSFASEDMLFGWRFQGKIAAICTVRECCGYAARITGILAMDGYSGHGFCHKLLSATVTYLRQDRKPRYSSINAFASSDDVVMRNLYYMVGFEYDSLLHVFALSDE